MKRNSRNRRHRGGRGARAGLHWLDPLMFLGIVALFALTIFVVIKYGIPSDY